MPAAPLMLQEVVHGDVTEDQSVNAHYNIFFLHPIVSKNKTVDSSIQWLWHWINAIGKIISIIKSFNQLMLQEVVHGDVTEDQSVKAHYNIFFTPYCIQKQDCRLFNPMIVALN